MSTLTIGPAMATDEIVRRLRDRLPAAKLQEIAKAILAEGPHSTLVNAQAALLGVCAHRPSEEYYASYARQNPNYGHG